jgi:hypothetical protein
MGSTDRRESKRRKPSPISKAQLAERKGVSKSAISKACLPGGPLAEAQLETGRIDLDHPATQAWLGDAAGAESGGDAPSGDAPKPDDLSKLGELTLNEIVEKYGSIVGFIDYIDARKKIAEIHRLELANAETEGELISRDLVRTHVFGLIDAVQRRLLTDTVKTLARRIYQMAQAKAAPEDAERVGADLVSAALAPLKNQTARTLRDSKA